MHSHLEMEVDSQFVPVAEFPREFKRRWYAQLDARFVTILLLSFFLQVGGLLLLSSLLNPDQQSLHGIHEKYARIFLENYAATDNASSLFEKKKETFLYGVEDHLESALDASNPAAGSSSLGRASSQSAATDTRFISSGSASSSRQGGRFAAGSGGNNGSTGAAVDDLSSQVASEGLLGYIITGNGSGSVNEELRSVFAQGDLQSRQLEGSLANVKLVSHRTIESNGGGRSGTSGGQAKGAKREVSAAEMSATFTPLEKASLTTIAKNTEVETMVPEALEKSGKKVAARKAEAVARVVLSHNLSIQDCYKQALKQEPALKGKVVVRFSITPSGSIADVQILQTTIHQESMLNCMMNRIRRWNDFGESDPAVGVMSYRQTYVFGY
ncbi:MAG: AgmX/PglI C-terminal domain-containing protein [candidate division KSB1 bacterium]|nr:AgmX/PglI C-terminal domain-containing protein [candidate division KSB1 bacterium]MDZ7340926.1 AgmX/PglI C-terminal domain-containing protein [candidate division KSB1 bacterium]